jgi:DNA polymerase-3 subunit beta
VKYKVNKPDGAVPEDLDIIIPARTVDVLKKIDSYTIVSFIEARGKKTHIRFDMGDSVFISRLINETFPPYETVIPTDFSFNLEFNHKDLLATINRVSIMTSMLSHQIRVHIENDTFSLTGQDESNGAHGIETLNCDYNGENFELAFNSKFLKEALENMSETGDEGKVILKFTEVNRPVIMIPKNDKDNLLILIMPVRVK